jgi:hypothetical protein
VSSILKKNKPLFRVSPLIGCDATDRNEKIFKRQIEQKWSGHLMGLKDRYPDADGSEEGWDDNIMGNARGRV